MARKLVICEICTKFAVAFSNGNSPLKTLKEYELPLKTLPQGKHTFSYRLDSKFFSAMESDEIKGGQVVAEITVSVSGSVYELTLTAKGNVTIECDRCLDDMNHHVDAGYHTFVKFGKDFDDSADDMLIIPESDNCLDASRLLYDTVALSVPLHHVHADGECNPTMSDILQRHSGSEADESEETDPRWEALKNFKNFN